MTKKSLLRSIALCLLVCICLGLAACKDKPGTDPTGTGGSEATAGTGGADATVGKLTYTIEVKTEGGMPLSDLEVFVYTDNTQEELVWAAKTNDAGSISFTDKTSDSYVAVLKGVSEGYEVAESYLLTGETTEIILKAVLLSGDDLTDITYKLGDVMRDFTVTDPSGTEYSLSELLKQKKAVVLNFWYIQCDPCKAEFPYLQQAYEKYSEDIALIAMNPVNTDPSEIAAFQQEMGLTFPMVACDPAWESAMQLTAYPTTVVIDRYGTVSMIHKGSIPDAQPFENAFAHFTAEDYQQGVVESIEDLEPADEEEAETGSQDAPIEVGGLGDFEITVGPGKVVYFDLYRYDGLYMQIKDSDAYVEYNDKTYTPDNGTVGLTLSSPDTFTPSSVAIGNSGEELKTFKVTFGARQGSSGNPYSLNMGQFQTNVSAGNDQGVYYTCKAAQDGVLTVTNLSATAGVEFDYILYNLNSYAYRTMAEEGTVDEDGNPYVSINVKKGQTVQLSVGTLPEDGSDYPAGKFTSVASFSAGSGDTEAEEEKIPYALTVTDENRKPLKNVYVKLDVDGTAMNLVTDEKGVASAMLPAGTYPAVITVPDGYTASNVNYQLTEAIPMIAVKLDTFVIVNETYTVKVVDQDGVSIPGVLVAVGSQFANTDDTGTVSFTMEQGSYKAVISLPEGYTSASTSFSFGEGVNTLVITLNKTTESTDPTEPGTTDPTDPGPTEPSKITYSVTVRTPDGKPQSGLAVVIGESLAVTNSGGVASVQLEPGDYPVAVSGTDLHYKPVTLTADAPAATVDLIGGVSGTFSEVYIDGLDYTAYDVALGSTYVELQPGAIKYFLFEPAEDGYYTITTSDPNAVVSYWSTVFFAHDATSSTDYENNKMGLNLNVGPTIVIGVASEAGSSVTGAILDIVREGDLVQSDEQKAEWIIYEAKTPPAAFRYTGTKNLTYVDITGKTGDYNLVLGSDGYYHLGSANGPLVYINLGSSAPYISIQSLVANTSLRRSFYDESGKFLRKEDYTQCMTDYVACIDASTGLYPLTEDLAYMIRNGGEYAGWWAEGGFLTTSAEGEINGEIAWMFACCYAD